MFNTEKPKEKKINKMTRKILYILLFIGCSLSVYSQCNYKLVEIAAAKSGENSVFIRDFKVKLKPGTMDNPSPVGRFPVVLNKGVHYRFTIANAEDMEGKAIMQLVRRDQVLGSTYDIENQLDIQVFDYHCDKSATYQILISFIHGKEGCAAGVLSMILHDSLEIADLQLQKEQERPVMYLFLPNKLEITATGIPGGKVKVDIDQGKVVKKEDEYIAYPDHEGEAIVQVASYKKSGELYETDSIKFIVKFPPLPELLLPGQQGSTLSKFRFMSGGEVVLYYPYETEHQPYILLEYTIATTPYGLEGYKTTDHITFQQMRLVNDLKQGDTLYLIDIQYKDPNGIIHTIKTVELLIIE